jgi:hypothetical protein
VTPESPIVALNAPERHDLLAGIHPARGRAFIRHVATAEVYPGGRVLIPVQARDKVAKMQFEIVALGNYEFCEADSWEDCPLAHHTKRSEHRHRLNVGDWVLVRNRAWDATPDPHIYIVRQEHILGVFKETV